MKIIAFTATVEFVDTDEHVITLEPQYFLPEHKLDDLLTFCRLCTPLVITIFTEDDLIQQVISSGRKEIAP